MSFAGARPANGGLSNAHVAADEPYSSRYQSQAPNRQARKTSIVDTADRHIGASRLRLPQFEGNISSIAWPR